MGYLLATSNLQVSNWWVNLPVSLSWRYLCPAASRPAFTYTPKILSEKHPKRANDIPHAKSPCTIFHTLLTARPEGCWQSWRLGTCTQHPALSPGWAWNSSSTELGGGAALYSLLKPFWLSKGISWEFWGLCWFESCYREALHRHRNAFSSFPPSVLSCKCQHESSGQKQEYQNGWVSCPSSDIYSIIQASDLDSGDLQELVRGSESRVRSLIRRHAVKGTR